MEQLDILVKEARDLDRLGRTIRFIPFVKTQPTPSLKHEETVCVAGVALDPLRWVRLYPIRLSVFRDERSFKKYECIDIAVSRPRNDLREESLRITSDPIVSGELIQGWNRRSELIAELPSPSLCELQAAIANNPEGQSLAAIEINTRPQLHVTHNEGWSKSQEKAIDKWAQDDLFGHRATRPTPTKYRIYLSFTCTDPNCKGHRLSLIDWEAGALERRLREPTIEYAQQEFQKKFVDQKFKPGKITRILVGNQGQPTNRASYMALGIFGPYDPPLARLF